MSTKKPKPPHVWVIEKLEKRGWVPVPVDSVYLKRSDATLLKGERLSKYVRQP